MALYGCSGNHVGLARESGLKTTRYAQDGRVVDLVSDGHEVMSTVLILSLDAHVRLLITTQV